MSQEWFVIGLLVVLIIAQNIFWARVSLSLANRLMSRDFQDFAYGKRISKAKNEQDKVQDVAGEVSDPEAERQAHELNSIFNMA